MNGKAESLRGARWPQRLDYTVDAARPVYSGNDPARLAAKRAAAALAMKEKSHPTVVRKERQRRK